MGFDQSNHACFQAGIGYICFQFDIQIDPVLTKRQHFIQCTDFFAFVGGRKVRTKIQREKLLIGQVGNVFVDTGQAF